MSLRRPAPTWSATRTTWMEHLVPTPDATTTRRWPAIPRISPADRDAWLAADTLLELGELTARWLDGDVGTQPGEMPGCGPSEETGPLIHVLTELNRAGLLTDVSQPGFAATPGADGALWAQRAAIRGVLDTTRAAQLAEQARAAGFIVTHYPAAPRWNRRTRTAATTVTTRDDQPRLAVGEARSRRSIRRQYGYRCHRGAVDTIAAAAQITIIDPAFNGRRDLWTFLSAWANAQVGYVADQVPERARERDIAALLALIAATPEATAYLAEDLTGPPAHRTVLYLNPDGAQPADMTRWHIHDQDVPTLLGRVEWAYPAFMAALPAGQTQDERLRILDTRIAELIILARWNAQIDDPWGDPS